MQRPEEPDIPLLPTVARLYKSGRYRRASVTAGPGRDLVLRADAERTVGAWRQRAELRGAAFNDMVSARDALAVAMLNAFHELAVVTPHQPNLPAEAASALTNATRALERALGAMQ